MTLHVSRVCTVVSVVALAASFVATTARADGPGAEVDTNAPVAPVAIAAIAAIAVAPEAADVAPRPAPYVAAAPAEVAHSHWYGWQTLLVDGASIAAGIGVGSSSASPGAGAAVWLGGYTLGAPIVHFAHGNVGRGFASFGLRVGAPLLGGYLGSWSGNRTSDGMAIGAGVGVLLGYITAVTVDSAVLARETVPEDEREPDDAPPADEPRSEERSMFKWTPCVAVPRGGGATGGISGTF